jgi:hypothetical protein
MDMQNTDAVPLLQCRCIDKDIFRELTKVLKTMSSSESIENDWNDVMIWDI